MGIMMTMIGVLCEKDDVGFLGGELDLSLFCPLGYIFGVLSHGCGCTK